MPRPTTLLFDLDGTLVDSLPDIAASANHVRAHFHLPPLPLPTIRSYVGDGLAALLRRSLDDPADVTFEHALALYESHHETQCTDLVVPYPGVVEHLTRWHTAGHPMGVVTNKPAQFARRILDHLDLARFLPVVIGGDSTPAKKPDPTPVHAAIHQLAPDNPARMIGDSPADVQAGKNAGIATAAVLYGYRDEPDLRATDPDEFWPRFGGPAQP